MNILLDYYLEFILKLITLFFVQYRLTQTKTRVKTLNLSEHLCEVQFENSEKSRLHIVFVTVILLKSLAFRLKRFFQVYIFNNLCLN